MSCNTDKPSRHKTEQPHYERGFRYQNVHWLWLSAAVILLDQIVKRLIVNNIQLYERVPLLEVLNITHLRNTGAAFSLLTGTAPWMFAALAVVVAVAILIWLRRHPYSERLVALSLSLILGGALGNAIDRVARGYVIDFIDFHIGTWHYPAFNVADCAIVIGAILMCVDILWPRRKRKGDESS